MASWHNLPFSRFAVALATLGLACVAVPGTPEAATSNVVFNANITANNRCTIVVEQDGALGVASNLRQLSSKIAGGSAGVARVTGQGRYDISAVTASVFAIGPTDANTGVTRQVLYSGARISGGGATFAEKDGSLLTRVTGQHSTRVTMHYVANRPTAFPGGHYEAIVVLRCE